MYTYPSTMVILHTEIKCVIRKKLQVVGESLDDFFKTYYTFIRNQKGSSYSRLTSKKSSKPAERQCLLIMWKHTVFKPEYFPEKDKNTSHVGSSGKWVH